MFRFQIYAKGHQTIKCLKTDWQTLVQTWKIKHLSLFHSVHFSFCPTLIIVLLARSLRLVILYFLMEILVR